MNAYRDINLIVICYALDNRKNFIFKCFLLTKLNNNISNSLVQTAKLLFKNKKYKKKMKAMRIPTTWHNHLMDNK